MLDMDEEPTDVPDDTDTTTESVGELFSHITHNQRLEFLGDAVLEFICSSHLFLLVLRL
jgi:dsRNA-specific ribonuclease